MEITHLADHQDVIPTIAKWFYREWSDFYRGRGLKDLKKSISERINRDSIPVALVAFEGKALAGTVCLKAYDMETRLDLSPWLAGLYVAESWRGKGTGTALVKAIEEKAKALGVRRLYLYTPNAESFYSGIAWQVVETTLYHGATVTIMKKEMVL